MPKHPPKITVDMARSAWRAGRLADAEAICLRLLEGNPDDTDVLELRGSIAISRRRPSEALAHFERCASLRPRVARFHCLTGQVHSMLGSFDEALASLDRALEIEPGMQEALEWKASTLEQNGDDEIAQAILEPFLEAGHETAVMAEVSAKLDIRARRFEQALETLRRHLAGDLPPLVRHRLGHLAGSAYEQTGDYDRAFEAHTEANRAAAKPFDPARFEAYIDALIETFSAAMLARVPRPAEISRKPVFIAGLPRSGTTLVEQIIDAHPGAYGAGEIDDIEIMVQRLQHDIGSLEPYPRCAADLEAGDVEQLAARYLERLDRIAPAAQRVVNKSLNNVWNLGLIAILFPGASIIHCRRDPRDVCVSCYMSSILPETYPFITDLRHLAFVWRQHERLVAHWKGVLDVPVLEASYEALIDDVEAESRKLIDFCGLAWDDRCLEFHRTGRAVKTLSYEQVRRPIYRTSVGRAKRFERHLGPLLEALSAGGEA